MGHYIKLFPIQFELFWIPPLSSSVKLWKLADCLLQLIIGECLDITIDICYMTTMLRTFDHGKQYSIKLSYRKYKIFSCLQLIYRIRDGLSMRFWLATLIFSKLLQSYFSTYTFDSVGCSRAIPVCLVFVYATNYLNLKIHLLIHLKLYLYYYSDTYFLYRCESFFH